MALTLIPERAVVVYFVSMVSCLQMLSGFWEDSTKTQAADEVDSLMVNKELQQASWIRRSRSEN